ncbi:MAG: hypothetical protein ABFD82_07080 [Syntrophaceae bacterium]
MRVKVCETHALARQRVEVRRLDLAAKRAYVGKSQVIAEDDNDVRPTGCVCGKGDGRYDEHSDHGDDAQRSQQLAQIARYPDYGACQSLQNGKASGASQIMKSRDLINFMYVTEFSPVLFHFLFSFL